jgi:hypothetical protein
VVIDSEADAWIAPAAESVIWSAAQQGRSIVISSRAGKTGECEVELEPGEHVCSRPLYPTPDYQLVVRG